MKSKLNTIIASSLLAAGLAAGITSAQAAGNSLVTPEKEKQVTAGMTSSQVSAALGSPVTIAKYGSDEGPTWIYAVAQGSAFYPSANLDFDVTFDSSGRVVSASEWEDPSND